MLQSQLLYTFIYIYIRFLRKYTFSISTGVKLDKNRIFKMLPSPSFMPTFSFFLLLTDSKFFFNAYNRSTGDSSAMSLL